MKKEITKIVQPVLNKIENQVNNNNKLWEGGDRYPELLHYLKCPVSKKIARHAKKQGSITYTLGKSRQKKLPVVLTKCQTAKKKPSK